MAISRPITTRAAADLGITADQLRSPRWKALHRGVHIESGAPADLVTDCAALIAVTCAHVAISDETAAALYGWWLPDQPSRLLHITVPKPDLVVRRGVVCHRRSLAAADRIDRDGLPVTSPTRTIADLAGHMCLIDLVVVVDAALHKRFCTLEELVVRARDAKFRGVRRLRRALELADVRSESPMETLLRLLFALSGLPVPTPQVNISDTYGVFIARVDLLAAKAKAVFEYDGAGHDAPLVHAHDIGRWRKLRAAGYEVFPYTAADLFRSPQLIVVDYQRVLGLPIDAFAVQGWLQEWRHSGFNPANRPPSSSPPRATRCPPPATTCPPPAE